MIRSRFLFCLTLTLVALAAAHVSKAQVAHLTLQSQPGDFIGQGGTYDITYTPANSQFFSAQVEKTIGSPPMPSFLDFALGTVTSGSDNTFATLDFATDQLGIPIQPGFYPDAQRASFASAGHPGLDVSFQNRGSNTLTGNFTVTNATFSSTNAIETFAVTFEQHSEGARPALFGTFTYDAVPEPSTLGLIACGAALLVRRRHSSPRRPSA
jgi:hypothetical protein